MLLATIPCPTQDAVFDDLDEATVLLNRMSARFATELVVGGRQVMKEGRIVTFDFETARRELLAEAQACRPRMAAARSDARLLTDVVRRLHDRG